MLQELFVSSEFFIFPSKYRVKTKKKKGIMVKNEILVMLNINIKIGNKYLEAGKKVGIGVGT